MDERIERFLESPVTLSFEPSYAGRKKVEVMGSYDPDPGEEDCGWIQFVDGCGYSPYRITKDEARRLAHRLLAFADGTVPAGADTQDGETD